MDESKMTPAFKRKKLTGYGVLVAAILLALANGPLHEVDVVGYVAISLTALVVISFFSWFFIKCTKCHNLYFASWQGQHQYKVGCRVCGDRTYE